MGEQTQRLSSGSLATLGAQTLLGAAGVMANLLRRPMSRSELVAVSSSEDEGSLRFIYELLGWVEATQVRLYCILIRHKIKAPPHAVHSGIKLSVTIFALWM